jgi:chromosome partitioning related protein ParA
MIERLSHREDMGFPLSNLYGLIYRMDRTADARATAEVLKVACYGPSRGRIMILDTVVPTTVAYREAASAQQPVHRWEPTRHGPTPSGLESMLSLVRELPVGLDKSALSPADLTRRLKP